MASLQNLPQSSARTAENEFPAGLRVLVVDDDVICLTIVEKMLRRCMYRGASTYLVVDGEDILLASRN